jgi:hypothetical protein
LNWHNRREIQQRSKIIEKELNLLAIRQSLSLEKVKSSPKKRRENQEIKLNQSLEETFRS